MNPAQLERYRVHVIDYLDEAEEIEAVKGGVIAMIEDIGGDTSRINSDLVTPFVRTGNAFRELFIQGEASTPVSTRGLTHWVAIMLRNISLYNNVKVKGDIMVAVERAAAPSILNKMSTADSLKFTELMIAQNYFASMGLNGLAGNPDETEKKSTKKGTKKL